MRIEYFSHGMCQIKAKKINNLEPIRNYFRTENPSKFYVEYHCSGAQVSNYLYGISSIGIFKTGMLLSVLKAMKSLGVEYSIDKRVIAEFLPLKTLGIKPIIKSLPNDGKEMPDGFILESRDYQTEAVKKYLEHGRGVIVLPTASGKSYVVAKTLYSLLQCEVIKNCLIHVPNTTLVRQFYNDLLDYGIPKEMVSRFCSATKNDKICKNTPIIISNRQWLEKHRKELPRIDVLFVDECHGIKSNNKSSEMLHEFETNIRFGCTATLPNSIQDRWELTGIIGPVLYKKSVVEMIDDKFISNMNITSIHVKDTRIDKDTSCLFSLNRKVRTKDISVPYNQEREYVANNIIRLYEKPIKHIQKYTKNKNTLWLFDFIDFGKALFDYMKTTNNNTDDMFYIDGNTKVKDREEILKTLASKKGIHIIAQSTCFNTGTNTKNLHNIVFVFNSKSDTKVMQSIGRGLRNHKGKTHFNLFDINFGFKYSKKHHTHRRDIYKKQYNKDIDSHVEFTI